MKWKWVKTRKWHQCHACKTSIEKGSKAFAVTWFEKKGPDSEHYCEPCALDRFKDLLVAEMLADIADEAYELALEKKRAGEKVPRWWNKMLTREELEGVAKSMDYDPSYIGEDWEDRVRKECNSGGGHLVDWNSKGK